MTRAADPALMYAKLPVELQHSVAQLLFTSEPDATNAR
jgi:hypothetical protein